MKYFYTALLSLLMYSGFSQEIDSTDQEVNFSQINIAPTLRGCEDKENESAEALKSCFQQGVLFHVAKNFIFPAGAHEMKMSAKIYVSFVIEKDGSISNIQVLKGAEDIYRNSSEKKLNVAKKMDEEAIRIVRSIEIIKPAYQKGKPVRMSFVLPINAEIK